MVLTPDQLNPDASWHTPDHVGAMPRNGVVGNQLVVPGADAVANERAKSTRVLRVFCARAIDEDPIKLKLTLTAKFLGRPFIDAVVKPFLTAYSKKVGETFTKEDVHSVLVDGVVTSVGELSTEANVLLPLGGEVRVEVRLLGAVPGADQSAAALVTQPDSQHPRFEDDGDPQRDWREAARTLFALSEEDARSWVLTRPESRLEDSLPERAPTDPPPALLQAAAEGVGEVRMSLVTGSGISSRAILFHPTAVPLPAGGVPLVVLLPGAHEHARSALTLWHAWRLVLEHRSAVLSIDILPHHGLRSPDGSDDASRHAAWPRPWLSDGAEPWSSDHFEACADP